MKRQKIENKKVTAVTGNAVPKILPHTVTDANQMEDTATAVGASSSSSSRAVGTGAADTHGVIRGDREGEREREGKGLGTGTETGTGTKSGQKGGPGKELRCRMSALSVEVFCASGTRAVGVSERRGGKEGSGREGGGERG